MKLRSILRSTDQLTILQKAGADGILLGIEGLSYRVPLYSVEHAMQTLHQAEALGLDVFLQLNRLLDEDEMQTAKGFIKQIADVGFAGIYFQDLAYVHFCEGLTLPLIYAPEAIITCAKEVATLCAAGIDRVMAAKELTLDEIVKMALENPSKIELFGFGHLPMAVSRRPLVRNYLEEIKLDASLSKGTGLRLKEEKRTVLYPILEDDKDSVIFADTVLCSLNQLAMLEKSGIYALIADDMFVDASLLAEFISSCKKVLAGEDPNDETERLSRLALDLTFSSGYYDKKTNLTKTGGNA